MFVHLYLCAPACMCATAHNDNCGAELYLVVLRLIVATARMIMLDNDFCLHQI